MTAKGIADWRRVLELSHFDARELAQENVASAAAELRKHQPSVHLEEVVRIGQPATELINQVEEVDADLIVTGARGRSGLSGFLLGSVSDALATEAPCPALIVRQAQRPSRPRSPPYAPQETPIYWQTPAFGCRFPLRRGSW